jgi:hypothetical protein
VRDLVRLALDPAGAAEEPEFSAPAS